MAALKHGIMGGTFDPVHNGHLELARCAQEQLSLDGVVWIPAGDPWRKGGRQIAPAEDRMAMVRLAVAGEPSWRVDTMEVDRTGPTYTVDTITALRSAANAPEYVLIMGQDALEDLPNLLLHRYWSTSMDVVS